MTAVTLRDVARSASFYPFTGFYLTGTLIVVLTAGGHLTGAQAVLALALAGVVFLLIATLRELRSVHRLVDGQRSELLARIDELAALLVANSVTVPAQGAKEEQARAQQGEGGTP